MMRPVLRLAALGVAAATLAACASSDREEPGTDEAGAAASGGSFIFGAAGAPSLFDPFYATDGETFRVSRQMFEGLVGFEPGTADVVPGLATSYESSEDGLTWTFALEEGVTFHDETVFDAAAVCANFERWYNQTGAGQSPAVSGYWIDNFGGFADGAEPSLYAGCEASDAATAVVTLTRVTSKFPAILGLPSFSMQSPTAMEQFDADNVQAAGDSFTFSEYAQAHPTGTGPFTFGGFDEANGVVTLNRNDAYWGEAPALDSVVFQVIPDETARRQALEAGTIDGYDFPSPADWDSLTEAGYNLEVRPAFNVFYVGITQSNNPALQDLRVRQALLHAIDRQGLVDQQLPEGAEVAKEFFPNTVDGYAEDVQEYPYDPELARTLLAEAGASDLTLNFYWPTEVTRPYMPSPQDLFTYIQGNLQEVGVTVNAVPEPWAGGYLDNVDTQQADLFLLGWTGDYNTADNFIGTFFGTTDNRFATGSAPWGQTLVDSLQAADSEPDEAARIAAYEALNQQIMAEYLPALPISHSPPAIVVSSEISGLVPSPLTDEKFADITKG